MNKIHLSFLISAFMFQGYAQAQVGRAWAWDAGKIQNNGALSIKTNNGSSSYQVTQNPIGAVAKTNQSTMTQPPTIIIQATSATGVSSGPSYNEAVAKITPSSVVPVCAAGYTKVWSLTYGAWDGTFISNIGNTSYSFGQYYSSQYGNVIGFFRDSQMIAMAGNYMRSDAYANQMQSANAYVGAGSPWSASLCTK